jgi:hypothetical protein
VTTRKQRGHETETTVSAWFKLNGWPYAEPVGAGRNGTDVTGMPGLTIEVKARRDFVPTQWLKQHALSPVPAFVVWRPDGFGPAAIGSWGVMMRLDDFTSLLHAAGYGTGED